jgi:hypothetical protein
MNTTQRAEAQAAAFERRADLAEFIQPKDRHVVDWCPCSKCVDERSRRLATQSAIPESDRFGGNERRAVRLGGGLGA